MSTATITETESEQAIRKALHELTIQRGNGIFNLPALRRILEAGLSDEPEKTVKRPANHASDLLGLDDNGGH